MKILIASVFSIDSYSRGIMPNILQTQLDENPEADIFYLTCSHSFDVCYFNIHREPDVCFRCKTGVKNTLSLVKGNFTSLKIDDVISSQDREFAADFFKNEPRIDFNQFYENFEVGEATLSTYISRSRDRDLNHIDQVFVKQLAENALALYVGLQRFIEDKEIEIVYNFNGRQDYVRAVLRAALSKGIDCYNLERTRMGGYIDDYKNVLPHNINYKAALVEKYWNESSLSLSEKNKIGASFYSRQKSGESIIFPSYTKGMTKGEIPSEIENGNKNIVLFNSSDDEFAALGKEFKNPLFKDQNEGITFLASLLGKEYPTTNLIVRMHPNLKGITHSYVQDLLELDQQYPNIFVIPPESKIDSYALMQKADKVISFGSTTGLEANFLGKPVILLGKSFYYNSTVAYVPTTIKELKTFLNSDLAPLSTQDALKFGFFYLKGGQKAKYYYEKHIGEGVFFKGHRVHSYSFFERFLSKIIQWSYRYFHVRLF